LDRVRANYRKLICNATEGETETKGLPRMRVDLGEFFLVQRDWFTSLVKYKKARAGGALIDAANEDFFSGSHCGCSALA
jgi:hypothetical protein